MSWEGRPLSACIEKVSVPAKVPRKSFLASGPVPIVSQEADFINGYWENEADAVKVSEPLVVFGDHTRVLKLIDFDFVVGADGVKLLKPKQFLDAGFLKYFLEANPFPSLGYARHYRHISNLAVPLPPLEEQKRIVAVLDQAFAALDRARANAEANLADAEELFERELASSFADASISSELRPFDKLCKPLTPKTKIKRKDYLSEGTHPIVSQEADLVSGYWDDDKALMGLSEPVVVFGDHTRCLKYVDFDFVVGADGTKVLKPAKGIDPLFLYYGLRSIPIAEKGYARHFRFLKESALPDLDDNQQRWLAHHLCDVEAKASRLAEHYEDKLQDIDDLRQSILQKAFAGELT